MKIEVKYVFETTIGFVKRRRKWRWFLATFPEVEDQVTAIDSGDFEFLDEYYEVIPVENVKSSILPDEEIDK